MSEHLALYLLGPPRLELNNVPVVIDRRKTLALLAYLAANSGRVLTHQSILTHVWGPADADHTEYLRVYMRQLRKKLEDDPERPRYILTEPGSGYRFLADE